MKPSCGGSSSSITELLCALCDSSLSGVSWKRRALGGVSREGFRRSLKRRAYGALLSKLFQDGTKGSSSSSGPSATARTPPRNRVLMISFDLRVAGCREEAERLEEQLGRLQGDVSSGLSEVDAVLELLVHLAGSAPPTATSFSRDYMRRERAVLRRPPPWGYQSEELQRLEARAWGLICGEEWGALERSYGSQRLMDAPPGTGLLALRTKLEAEERFERETRMTLFGAMQHTRTADIDIRLDLPPIPSNIDVTGLAIRVPPCLDQSEDEGFQSASNLTPDSQSEPSPVPDIDVWEAVRTFEPGRRRCWESVGWYLSELCCEDGPLGAGQATFPVGVKLLSYLYNEAQNNCSNENYPVLLSLLKNSCEPYTRFVSDWVYNGVFRDVHGEFMIQVNEDYLSFRDKHFWVQGYTLISKDVEDCVPIFLKHIANDVYVCGKTINLLKICCPQHYICWSELPVPPIAVTFSLQEVEEIERDCAVYRGRMERIAKHSAISREEQALRTEQARQELINQVSQRLAEEAKKRERFEELKQHLEQEQEVSSSQELPEQQPAETQEADAIPSPPPDPSSCDPALISDDVDINDFLPKSPNPDSQQVDTALQEIGSDLPEVCPTAQLVDYDFCAPFSPLEGIAAQAPVQPRPRWGPAVQPDLIQNHPSFSHIPIGENISQVQENVPKTSPFGQASKSSFPLGQYTPEETQNTSKASVYRRPSRAAAHEVDGTGSTTDDKQKEVAPVAEQDTEMGPLERRVGIKEVETVEPKKEDDVVVTALSTTPGQDKSEHKVVTNISDCGDGLKSLEANTQNRLDAQDNVDKIMTLPNIQGHVSSAHLKVGELVSDVVAPQPSASVHGHSSDAHIKVGQFASEVTAPLLSPHIHGHATDSHIEIRQHVSEVGAPLPSPSVHGQSSDAHIKVGENVSEFIAPLPTPNIHGHASDAHLKVGGLISTVVAPLPSPNVHGHSSDAHIKVGENVSDVVAPLPTPSIHGHSSDANIKVGEFVSNISEARPLGSKHGHASDCALQSGCVVSGVEPTVSPLPGSSYGHSSDSALGTGCAVSGVEPKRLPLPGSAHGHSSDSALGTGCAVSGVEPKRSPLPGSAYGHSSDSSLGVGCVVKSKDCGDQQKMEDNDGGKGPGEQLVEGLGSWAAGFGLSPGEQSEQEYLLALSAQYEVDLYEDCYNLMASSPECQLLKQVTRGPWGLPMDPTLRRATDTTAVQLSEMVSLPVLIKHSVTAPLITHVSLVNKAVVDYFFVELGVERHFEALRHFLLMEDGEFAQSLSDLLFEKLGSGQTPGELLTPLVLNSILSKALQYSLHGDTPLAGNFTFALRFFPETFHPHAPDSLNCLELRYKVDWPLNIIITDSCMNKYNRLFSFLLQLKHMVWSLRDVWFHLKRTALVKGAGRSVQFHQLQLYRHEMQHFVKVIQGYIANQILQVSWSEFTAKLAGASDLDAIHRTHADYLNRAIFRGLLTEKAAPVMNIIHSIFSLILKFRAQLIAQAWDSQHGEAVHPSFVAMQQSYNTFKYYSHFLFKVVTKLVNRGYQPHLEDFLLRINFNNYYKDS
ncbi:hypothetical protein F2P81_006518 [Scophthalmus maximus]|uniref:Gamma-tubulin complex component 6 n=1 Tax=Scophthalmus maximus TaxID=52904 RepID=A0A6A4T9N4_SCOMX|nr:hypothetical protein F2P81_006518 [Scophthalmus maximus]